jgi:hypothetical protein
MRLRDSVSGLIMAVFLAVLVVGVMGFVDLSDEFRDGGRGGGGSRAGGGGSRVGSGGARYGGGGGRVGGGGRHHGGGGHRPHHHRGGGYYGGGYGGGSSWGWGWPYWGLGWWGVEDCTITGCPYPETCNITDTGFSFCA